MLDVINKRFSCRKFLGREVEKNKIMEIVNAGLKAPSGMNKQEGVVIVITDQETRELLSMLNNRIGKMKENIDPFYGAPVILLVAHKKSPLAVYNGAAMIENMLLEATNQGLGSCWVHRAYEELLTPIGTRILARCGLDANEYEGIGHIALGYADAVSSDKVIKDNRAYFL